MSGRSAKRWRGKVLEAILRRLARPEVIEGALGDLDEAYPGRAGRRAAELLQLAAGLVFEEMVRSLREPGSALSDETPEAAMEGFRRDAVGGMVRLTVRWILASALGWAGGLAAAVALTLAGQSIANLNPDRFLAFASLVCLGVTVGLAQSLVIGPFVGRLAWVGATFAGHLLALIPLRIPRFPNFPGPEVYDNLVLLALVGAAIGGAQWMALRVRFRGAWIWPPVTALGYLGFLWVLANPTTQLSQFALVNAAIGAAGSILPGIVLAWLASRQPAGEPRSGAHASVA